MADNFIEYWIRIFQKVFEDVLAWFNFEILGKNIRSELVNIIPMVIFSAILLISFKIFFSRSTTIIGKVVILMLFIMIFLLFNIWIF